VNLGDNLMPPNQFNPYGYWENNDIVTVNERLLRDLGTKWDMIGALPHKWWRSEAAEKARQSLLRLLERQFCGKEMLWAVKDPRMCRLMPLWFQILAELGVRPLLIYSVRHPLEVSRSLSKRDGFSPLKGLMLWFAYNQDAIIACQNVTTSAITYDQLLSDPIKTLSLIENNLGISFPRSLQSANNDILNFVRQDLKKQKIDNELKEGEDGFFHYFRLYEKIRSTIEERPFLTVPALNEPDENNQGINDPPLSFQTMDMIKDEWAGAESNLLMNDLFSYVAESERIWVHLESIKKQIQNKLDEPIASTDLIDNSTKKGMDACRVNKTAFAAFMENGPIFELQAFYWAISLLESGTAKNPEDIHLFVPANLARIPEWVNRLGIRCIPISYFDSRHPYCNKIGMWKQKFFATYYSHVCFTDCDLFFISPTSMPLSADFSACIVDRPNPSWSILMEIFNTAGVKPAPQVLVRWPLSSDEVTASTNCNGGFYFVRTDIIETLGKAWGCWARWILDRPRESRLLGAHVDQTAMAIALCELDIEVQQPEKSINIPTHIETLSKVHEIPTVLHYHKKLNEQGLLKLTGDPYIDQAVEIANKIINRRTRNEFNNRIFWNARYSLFPELGSGVGSRKEALVYKRRFLEPFSSVLQSTIDIGCGDTQATIGLPFKNYLGVDCSEEAIQTAKKNDPNRKYMLLQDFIVSNEVAGLSICLDVAIHQPTYAEYQNLINLAVNRSKDLTLISGFDGEPQFFSAITFYYESISKTLTNHSDIRRIEEVGRYRDMVVYAAIKKGGMFDRNTKQLSFKDLSRAFRESPFPQRLLEIYRISFERLGFFTSHYPRVFEYPWICQMTNDLPAGIRVLDIGTGVCPLPLWMAEQGFKVLTVDSHQKKNTADNVHSWNEWGFLDYNTLDDAISSINADVLDINPAHGFDVIYSVSVLEHLPAAIRREILNKLEQWLLPGGKVLVTLDLVPNSNEIWNMSEGNIAEEPSQHGNLSGLVKEIIAAGLNADRIDVYRNIYNSRTDVAFLQLSAKN
jgi:2-polyprenyl-3-methyl-5-hydroxy-6-metoxy-1,4-benzoquinol methylase